MNPSGFVLDDASSTSSFTSSSSNESDEDPCPPYTSLGGGTGGVGGEHQIQEQLSDALVGLDAAIAGLDAILGHFGAGTVEGTSDLFSGSNKAAGSDENAFLPSYADTRLPSFIHLSTTSTDDDASGVNWTASDLDVDTEVRNLTSTVNPANANPANPTSVSSTGRFLGARPRDRNPLRRSNAFRSPADDMDNLRTYREGGSTADPNIDLPTDEGGSTIDAEVSGSQRGLGGHEGGSHHPLTNHSHTFCPVGPFPLRRSYGCGNLPTCVVYPTPRPVPGCTRSLVSITEAAASDPSLLIHATVAASAANSLPVHDGHGGISQFRTDTTQSVGTDEQPPEVLPHHTGPGGSDEAEEGSGGGEEPNGPSGAAALASVWTPTTAISGVTFGAVSGSTKTILFHIISYIHLVVQGVRFASYLFMGSGYTMFVTIFYCIILQCIA